MISAGVCTYMDHVCLTDKEMSMYIKLTFQKLHYTCNVSWNVTIIILLLLLLIILYAVLFYCLSLCNLIIAEFLVLLLSTL